MTYIPKNPKPQKLQKKLSSYFRVEDVVMGDIHRSDNQEPPSSYARGETHIEREGDDRHVGDDDDCDVNHIECDPSKRPEISSYPINDQDEVRIKFILLEPYQPKLEEYPTHLCGDQERRFNRSWFAKYHWLEYFVTKDNAYCFPCSLSTASGSQALFTSHGFDNWRKISRVECRFKRHVGKNCSPHYKAMQDWLSLKHVCRHIDKVMNLQPPKLILQNKLRRKATIEAVRWLAKQVLAFRGHDESVDSSNRGNMLELVDSYGK